MNSKLIDVYDMLRAVLDRQKELEEEYRQLEERFDNVTEKLKLGMYFIPNVRCVFCLDMVYFGFGKGMFEFTFQLSSFLVRSITRWW